MATGGQAHMIVSGSRYLKTVDEHLTLEGLQMIWERNRECSATVLNYFNYFTEIEEHFQRARGTSLFLLSPLDWALVESWKNAGVPLEAVLRGIDTAFEKWRGAQGEDPDGEFAGLLRAGRAHRSADHGRKARPPGHARSRAAVHRRGTARLSARRNAAALPRGLRARSPNRCATRRGGGHGITPTWKSWSSSSPCSKRK